MTISRRQLIKQVMLATAGAALLPGCNFEKKEIASDDAFLLSEDQNKLLAEMAETIIPKTNIPGAKDVKVEEFINVMATDCFDKETQDKFMKGLTAVNDLSKKQFDKSFIESTPEQRIELFTDLSNKKEDLPTEAIEFFPMIKGLTIHGYMTSQHILTDVNPWVLVPGPAKGCVEVKAA